MNDKPEERAEEKASLLPVSEESHQATAGKLAEEEPTPRETARLIADRLGETGEAARQEAVQIVWALGRTQARALLERTLQIEEHGGMMLPDGSRRRSVGGVFFHLAYTTGIPKAGKFLKKPAFRPPGAKVKARKPAKNPAPTVVNAPPLAWDERIAIIEEIGTAKGTVTNVKITLIGKLGTYVDKGTCIVGVMQAGESVPTLPKGLLVPPATSTAYVVYIAAKQWKQVAMTVSDGEDALIIEGFPQIDVKTGSIAVFATTITSKKIQAAKRQGQSKGDG
jgi:hypothetical protein